MFTHVGKYAKKSKIRTKNLKDIVRDFLDYI